MPGCKRLARPEVGADVFADGRVGAAPGLDGKNSAGFEEAKHKKTRKAERQHVV